MIKRILFLAIAALVAGCYPGGPEYTDELDLVATSYDKSYSFPAANTYAIPDQIPLIDGTPNTLDIVDAATAKVILDGIKANMTSMGYTLSNDPGSADVTITVAALEVTTTTVYCNDWWGYWGWWGYYPGYPGYGGCYYPTAYSYSTGTVLISMVDDKSEDGKPETPVRGVWSSAINGLLAGNSSSTSTRITNSINQAFTQSPYLKTN